MERCSDAHVYSHTEVTMERCCDVHVGVITADSCKWLTPTCDLYTCASLHLSIVTSATEICHVSVSHLQLLCFCQPLTAVKFLSATESCHVLGTH